MIHIHAVVMNTLVLVIVNVLKIHVLVMGLIVLVGQIVEDMLVFVIQYV